VHPGRVGRYLRELHGLQVGEVREEAAAVVQDLGIVRVRPAQLESHLHRFVVLLQAGVGTLEVEPAKPPERGVGGLAEALAQAREGLFVLAELREGHSQQDIDPRQPRLQLHGLTKRRNRRREVALLKVDETELGMHLGRGRRELLELLVGLRCIGVASRGEGRLSLPQMSVEHGRVGRGLEERRGRQ
jgi:hypothetical protein